MKIEARLPDGYTISYAQNREDVIIRSFFPDVQKGFYVDVGANHPEEDSVTKIFYDKGWNGINIEPNTSLFRLLQKHRKRDTNLNVGISDKPSSLNFREYNNHGLSTFSRDVQEEHAEEGDARLSYHDYVVKVVPMGDVVGRHLPDDTVVNFMKIDVEGYEYEVMAGNDWKLFRPELICVEANHVKHDWRPILKKARYTLVFHDGINEYYLREESMSRLDYFDYARDVVLSGIVVGPGVAKRIIDGEEDRFTVQEQDKRIAKLIEENADLERNIAECQSNLTDRRFLLRMFLKKRPRD